MSASERIRQELREVGLVTLFFLLAFLFFLLLKKLLLEEYDVKVSVLGTALIGALVVAKVVVILDKTPLGNWFKSGRLAVHVLWRSLVYTIMVFVVTLAEHLFDAYREVGSFSEAVSKLWAIKDPDHFIAMNLAVGVSLLAYNVVSAISHHLGEGRLHALFFSRSPEPHSARQAGPAA